MKQDFTNWRNQILQNPRDISPLKFGISQDGVIEIFGNPDAVSTMRSDGKPLILKYHDIELHFDRKAPHGLCLVYSDDEIELSITAEHEETLQPITNTEPVDNEFFLRDGTVYFSGLYENGLLKGVAPKDFCCWRYWGKSSTACFLGGIRLRGADPASFRVLNYAYAMDKTAVYTTSGRIPDVELAVFQVLDNGQNDSGAPQGYAKDGHQVYFHNGDGKVKVIKGAEVSSFCSLGDTYFAKDEKRIYAYGKQLPKAELTSWELLGHWYSRDAKRVYYLNREIKEADRDSFTVCTPLDAPPLADHLARDKEHFYQNDEIMEETQWLEQLRKMTKEHKENTMKNLFIDANIWLSLYHFTSDDLEQFGKLKSLIGTDIRLFVPSQILDEIHRNREAKIKDAFDKFEKFHLEFPTFCKNYEEYKSFYEKYKELKDKHKEWISKIKIDILEQSLPADKVLDEFFEGVSIIECGQDTINKAVLRYNTGNPPGKDKKYGDAINWECLLNNVPDGEDLFFISADRDYSSSFDDKNFNPFLRGEWETKKNSNIMFFRSLVEFLNKHFKDIELKTEREKDDLIEGLERSRSFATTHAIVAQLVNYSDWSVPQIIDLSRIALNNFQVTWILGDPDVNAFFKSLLSSKVISKSDNNDILQLRNKIDEIDKEREADIEEIDDSELPF